MFEVVLAISMMVGYLSYIEHTFQRPARVSLETISDEKLAQDVLLALDLAREGNTTFIRHCLAQGNYSGIEERTRQILPRNYLFSYSISDQAGSRPLPKKGKTSSVAYLIYDQNDTQPISYVVRLSIWSAG